MKISERAEEMLETLWVSQEEDKKESTDIGLAKNDQAINELQNLGCIKLINERIVLTKEGKNEGQKIVRRHRISERLFADVLDIKKRLVHPISCQFEHLLQEGIEDNICIMLGHPKTCPHGKPIPEGSCCKAAATKPKRLVMPLTELEINKKSKIVYLQTHNRAALGKLTAIGVLPNLEITLIQKFPSYVFQIGKSQFAVDKELASHIYVRVL